MNPSLMYRPDPVTTDDAWRKTLHVPPGHRALLYVHGEHRNTVGPGTHVLDTRLARLGEDNRAGAVILRDGTWLGGWGLCLHAAPLASLDTGPDQAARLAHRQRMDALQRDQELDLTTLQHQLGREKLEAAFRRGERVAEVRTDAEVGDIRRDQARADLALEVERERLWRERMAFLVELDEQWNGTVPGVSTVTDKGEMTLLQTLLTHRFGPLPDWALERLQSAVPPQLETWTKRLLDADSLTAVFDDD